MAASLAVVAIDDPESPKTWSGTPLALLEGMRSLGRDARSLSADAPRAYDRALYGALGVPLFGKGARGFRQYYGPRKKRLERRVSDHRSAHPETFYVHTDHMWTPFPGMNSRDYFFRDSSWSAYADSQGLSRRLRKRIDGSVQESFQRAGHIFATSEWAKGELVREGGRADRITVVGTGVGNLVQPYFTKDDYSNKRTLCVAKVRLRNKGLDLLLDGFRIAHSADPELRLDLVVPAGAVAPQPGVTVHSALSGAKLIELYRSAALYAMPARYEPWGLVYLEAQLSALPVLGSSNCAFPELANFGANGYILPHLSAENVATALLNAHSDPDQLRKRGQAGLLFAQQFTWRRTVDAMLSVIDASAELT